MMQPGWSIEVRRQKQQRTRFPGVWRVGDETYRVRARTLHPKTGKTGEIDRVITASDAAEAARQKDDLVREAEGRSEQAERLRLSTYLDTWIARKKVVLAPSTLDRYARTLQTHVLPALGEYYLDAITHADVVEWRNALTGEPSSINSRFRVLKTALADAVIEHQLPRNPAERIPCLPEGGYDDEEPNSLTPEQLRSLLDAMRRHAGKWYPLFATLAYTGARVGEVTALRWEDLDGAELLIRRSHWMGRIRFTTKTNRWRRVPVPESLAAILGDHRRALLAAQGHGSDREQERARRRVESGWVFPSSKGTPTLPSVVRNKLLEVLDGIEQGAAKDGRASPLPHFTVHGLRRTVNNLLRQAVQDKTVVRAIIGHATERMTEHYSSVRADEKSAAVTLALVHPLRKSGTSRGPSASEAEKPVDVAASNRL